MFRESTQVSEAEDKDIVVSKTRHYPKLLLPEVCVLERKVYNSFR